MLLRSFYSPPHQTQDNTEEDPYSYANNSNQHKCHTSVGQVPEKKKQKTYNVYNIHTNLNFGW